MSALFDPARGVVPWVGVRQTEYITWLTSHHKRTTIRLRSTETEPAVPIGAKYGDAPGWVRCAKESAWVDKSASMVFRQALATNLVRDLRAGIPLSLSERALYNGLTAEELVELDILLELHHERKQ